MTHNHGNERRGNSERAWKNALLDWLNFAEMKNRRDQVADAHIETFRWLFEKRRDKNTFPEWLQTGDGIFLIRGKPASGKSTLMKFIIEEPRFRAAVESWSGSTPLLIIDYWFWATGSRIQSSLDGLYRAILYRILKATNSELSRTAFPDWQMGSARIEPTTGALAAAMKRVIKSIVRSTNLFFIIDGLDELRGDERAKDRLVDILENMASSTHVKLLLSSRPENTFIFDGYPAISLEKFTRPDIVGYVCDRIRQDDVDENRNDQIRRMQNYIIRYAQGVFLWVYITVSIAVDGFKNHEDIQAIRQRIEKLPPQLDDLFTHVLNERIPAQYQTEAFRYIWIVLECQRMRDYWPGLSAQRWDGDNVPAVALAVAQQASNHSKASFLVRLGSDAFEKNTLRLQDHLHSRCQGLLEFSVLHAQNPERTIKKLSCVYFLHRTLYEYLTQNAEVLALLKAKAGEQFDVYRAIMTG